MNVIENKDCHPTTLYSWLPAEAELWYIPFSLPDLRKKVKKVYPYELYTVQMFVSLDLWEGIDESEGIMAMGIDDVLLGYYNGLFYNIWVDITSCGWDLKLGSSYVS